jgi:hypothetical protein
MRSKIIETAKRHIATIWPSYHQKMKSLASMLKKYRLFGGKEGGAPFLTSMENTGTYRFRCLLSDHCLNNIKKYYFHMTKTILSISEYLRRVITTDESGKKKRITYIAISDQNCWSQSNAFPLKQPCIYRTRLTMWRSQKTNQLNVNCTQPNQLQLSLLTVLFPMSE